MQTLQRRHRIEEGNEKDQYVHMLHSVKLIISNNRIKEVAENIPNAQTLAMPRKPARYLSQYG
jgi:hypothetical protein